MAKYAKVFHGTSYITPSNYTNGHILVRSLDAGLTLTRLWWTVYFYNNATVLDNIPMSAWTYGWYWGSLDNDLATIYDNKDDGNFLWWESVDWGQFARPGIEDWFDAPSPPQRHRESTTQRLSTVENPGFLTFVWGPDPDGPSELIFYGHVSYSYVLLKDDPWT